MMQKNSTNDPAHPFLFTFLLYLHPKFATTDLRFSSALPIYCQIFIVFFNKNAIPYFHVLFDKVLVIF